MICVDKSLSSNRCCHAQTENFLQFPSLRSTSVLHPQACPDHAYTKQHGEKDSQTRNQQPYVSIKQVKTAYLAHQPQDLIDSFFSRLIPVHRNGKGVGQGRGGSHPALLGIPLPVPIYWGPGQGGDSPHPLFFNRMCSYSHVKGIKTKHYLQMQLPNPPIHKKNNKYTLNQHKHQSSGQ